MSVTAGIIIDPPSCDSQTDVGEGGLTGGAGLLGWRSEQPFEYEAHQNSV
jgi:hypothetical protein